MRMRAPSSFESPFPPLEHAKSSRSFSLFFSHFPATTTFQRRKMRACSRVLCCCCCCCCSARDEELKICARRGALSRGEFVKKRTRFKRKRKETPGPRRGTRVRRAAIASRPIFVFFFSFFFRSVRFSLVSRLGVFITYDDIWSPNTPPQKKGKDV